MLGISESQRNVDEQNIEPGQLTIQQEKNY
jgi:hypothetical protein